MCNHYRNHPEAIETWAEYVGWNHRESPFSETKLDVWPARPTATEPDAITYPGTVVRWDGDRMVFDRMPWGIVTTIKGAKGQPLKKAVTNVRNYTSPFWRSALADPRQRCLVPFTAFAEPIAGAGREEHWFLVEGRPVACFAGIWRMSEGLPRFAFLTCEPNPLVAPLHPKAMPVILHEEDHDRWMGADFEEALSLACAYPSQLTTLAA